MLTGRGKIHKGTAAAAAAFPSFPFLSFSRPSLSISGVAPLFPFWGGVLDPLGGHRPLSLSERVRVRSSGRGLLSQKTSRNNAIRKEKAPSIPHMYKL